MQRGVINVTLVAALIGAAGGALLAGGASRIYYTGRIDRMKVEQHEAVAAANAAVDAANETWRLRARAHELERARQAASAAKRQGELKNATTSNPGWSNAPVPDGVRRALEAAAADAASAAGGAAGAVPGAGGAKPAGE
jgi:hypothetical protein